MCGHFMKVQTLYSLTSYALPFKALTSKNCMSNFFQRNQVRGYIRCDIFCHVIFLPQLGTVYISAHQCNCNLVDSR